MDTTTLEQLIEKCQQLKIRSEFECQTHNRIHTEFIKLFLNVISDFISLTFNSLQTQKL